MGFWASLVTETRPWIRVFFNKEYYSFPKSLQDADSRMWSNLIFFRANYSAIALALFMYNIITNFYLLVLFSFLVTLLHLITRKKFSYSFYGRTIKRRHCVLALFVAAVPLSYAAGLRIAFLCTSELTFIVVICHALLYDPGGESPRRNSVTARFRETSGIETSEDVMARTETNLV